MGEERLGQGRENAVEFLTSDAALLGSLEAQIREKYGLPVQVSAAPAPGGEDEETEGEETLDLEE